MIDCRNGSFIHKLEALQKLRGEMIMKVEFIYNPLEAETSKAKNPNRYSIKVCLVGEELEEAFRNFGSKSDDCYLIFEGLDYNECLVRAIDHYSNLSI